MKYHTLFFLRLGKMSFAAVVIGALWVNIQDSVTVSIYANDLIMLFMGAQWLSGRVLDSRPKGCGFEPHWRHWVVVLEQDTFILA